MDLVAAAFFYLKSQTDGSGHHLCIVSGFALFAVIGQYFLKEAGVFREIFDWVIRMKRDVKHNQIGASDANSMTGVQINTYFL